MKQIFDEMADITLNRLKKYKVAKTFPGEEEIQMVLATLQLYNFIADNHQSELFR